MIIVFTQIYIKNLQQNGHVLNMLLIPVVLMIALVIMQIQWTMILIQKLKQTFGWTSPSNSVYMKQQQHNNANAPLLLSTTTQNGTK